MTTKPSAYQVVPGKTVPFTEEDIKGYLDRCITYWRNKRGTGDATARYYIDAFQSVRMSLFGELLDWDKGD